MNHFVLVVRDDNAWAIGPFDTQDTARAWAKANWDEGAGDPRWQVLALPNSMIATIIPSPNHRVVELPLHAPDQPAAVL